jgi:hypothetical protein
VKRNKGRGAVQMVSIREKGSASDKEEWFCLVCVDNYKNSSPNEEWVQCITCKEWAHVRRTKGEIHECPKYLSN